MLRVMIVDDEPIIRRGIEAVPNWGELGCEVVCAVENGVEALEKAAALKPDIVITDIMMPEMDGLELSERLCQLLPDTKIILLTGYKDFEYAKKAITLSVFDYLLKPIDPDDLCKVVQKAADEIARNQAVCGEVERMRAIVAQSRPLLREKFLSDLLFGGQYSKGEIVRKLAYFDMEIDRFVLVCVELDASLAIKSLFSEEDYMILLYLVNERLQELLEKNEIASRIVLNGLCVYAILGAPPSAERLSVLLIELKDSIEQKHRFTVSVYASNAHTGAEQVALARGETDRCRAAKFSVGDNCVIFASDIQAGSGEEAPIDIDGFIKAVSIGGDLQKEKKILADALLCARNAETVRNTAIEAIIGGVRAFGGSPDELAAKIGLKGPLASAVGKTQTAEQVVEIFARVADAIEQEQNKQRTSRHNAAVESAVAYIHEHLKDTLTLEEIASKVYMSPCYFSKIFKKVKGWNLSDYLIDLRIKKACDLMRTRPELKNYEIAEEVGIQNVHYYNQLFKKVTQMTPGEYRGKAHVE